MTRWLLVVPAVVAVAVVGWAVHRRRGRTRLSFARQRLRWVQLSLEDGLAKLLSHCGPDLLEALGHAASVLDARAGELAAEPDDLPGLVASLTERYDRAAQLSLALPVISQLERNRASAQEGTRGLAREELVQRLADADGRRTAMVEVLRSGRFEAADDAALRSLADEYLSISADAYLATGRAFDEWAADARRRAGEAEPRRRQRPSTPPDDDPGQREWGWPE